MSISDAINQKLTALAAVIGNTPVQNIGGVMCKLENRNPAGSVKDRAAFYIIKNALLDGSLQEGGKVVEATSGNTGIGLAYVCRELGLSFTATMPSSMSKQRIALMESYGATVELTPAELGMNGAVNRANEIAAKGAYLANQFGNLSGVQAHYETTAPEIFNVVPDCNFIVCGIGSGGTYTGIKKYVEEHELECEVIGLEPYESPLLTKGIAGAHKIQGIGANFVPALINRNKLGDIYTVKGEDALSAVKQIYRLSGEKVGISSGAAYHLALQIRREHPEDCVVAICPDGGDRYDQQLYV